MDEMCNFYIMYYTDYPGTLRIDYCIRNAQTFHWVDYGLEPPVSVSSIDDLPPFVRDDPFAETDKKDRLMKRVFNLFTV